MTELAPRVAVAGAPGRVRAHLAPLLLPGAFATLTLALGAPNGGYFPSAWGWAALALAWGRRSLSSSTRGRRSARSARRSPRGCSP